MNLRFLLTTFSISSALASDSSTTKRQNEVPDGITTSPCAQISVAIAANSAVFNNGTPMISAQLGYDCLNSVPLYKQEALELVDQIILYLSWHSGLADLKSPPADYPMPPIDLIGSMQNIKTKLQQDQYANEYHFQVDVFQTVGRGYDGHLYFWPDLLTSVIAFNRVKESTLVSVSEDGLKLPKTFLYDDIRANITASAVVEINGIAASQYLDDMHKQYCQFQDKDACYNALFLSVAGVHWGNYGGFQGNSGATGYVYPGANTTLLFENGTTVLWVNYAVVTQSFEGVTDGDTFYEKFCRESTTPADDDSVVNDPTTASGSPTSSVPGYPESIISSSDNSIHGYYLSGPSISDVAVLVVANFVPSSPTEFQALVEDFLSGARADGKNKIIIDVTGNTGGYTMCSFDLYHQFFPNVEALDYARIRRTDAFDLLANLASNASLVPSAFDDAATEQDIDRYRQSFNSRYDLNESLGHFESPADMLEGRPYQADTFTAIKRWDLANEFLTSNDTWALGIEMTGYGTRANATQYFQADEILLLTDGTCSSACVLLGSFLRDAGVQSIVFGGRPHTGQMQALGGAKSLEAWSFDAIYDATSRYYDISTIEEKVLLDTYTLIPRQRASFAGVNLKDYVHTSGVKDGSLMSAQFVRDEADCRLFYTGKMVRDVEEVWKAAAEARWGGGRCFAGGFKAGVKREENGDARVSMRVERSQKWKGKFAKTDPKVMGGAWRNKHMLKLP